MWAFVFQSAALILASDCLVIQPTWNHVKFKKVPPARLDGRLTSEVEVTCSATGSPAPEVAWYKDSLFIPHLELAKEEGEGGASIGETVAKLRIPCLSSKDVGLYECRARAGKMEASATMELNAVEFQDNLCVQIGEPQILLWRPTVMLEEGSTAVLPCRTENKEDMITWTSTGGGNVDLSSKKFSQGAKGELLIHDLRFSDMGEYICTASNGRGSKQVKTFLYPLAPGGLTTF